MQEAGFEYRTSGFRFLALKSLYPLAFLWGKNAVVLCGAVPTLKECLFQFLSKTGERLTVTLAAPGVRPGFDSPPPSLPLILSKLLASPH